MAGHDSSTSQSLGIPILGFLMAAAIQVAWPLLSLFVYEAYNLSIVEVGYVLTVFNASQFLAKIPVGFLVTSRLVYPAVVAAFLIMFVSYLALAFSPSVLVFAAGAVVLGFGIALNRTAQFSLATMLPSRERVAEYMRNYTAGLGLGFTAGPAIGTASVGVFGLRNTLIVAGFVAVTGALFAVRMGRGASRSGPGGEKAKGVSRAEFFGLVRNRQVFASTVALLHLALVNSILVAFVPIHAKTVFALPDSAIVSLFLGLAAVTFASRLLIGRRLSHRRFTLLMGLGLMTSTLGLVALAFSPLLWLYAVGFLLLGFQQGLILPLGALVIAGHTSAQQRVMGNAVGLAGQDAGRLLGPLSATLLIPVFGIPYSLVLYALTAPLVLGLASAVKIRLPQE